jgi:hypothetical protein
MPLPPGTVGALPDSRHMSNESPICNEVQETRRNIWRCDAPLDHAEGQHYFVPQIETAV